MPPSFSWASQAGAEAVSFARRPGQCLVDVVELSHTAKTGDDRNILGTVSAVRLQVRGYCIAGEIRPWQYKQPKMILRTGLLEQFREVPSTVLQYS